MITFNEIGRYGRLGNQLFQLAILKVVSLKTGYDIILPEDINERNHHGQNCLLNNFKFETIKYGSPIIKNNYIENNPWDYDEQLFTVPDNTNFFGFFQNQKYYAPYQNELMKEFQVIDEIQNKINSIIKNYNKFSVSLHVRRGDATDGTNYSEAIWGNDVSENSIIMKYYNHALSLIPSNSTVFLFTGGSRYNDSKSDFEWCRKNFKDNRIIFVDFLNDIESFTLMKSCDYNITSFVSSFSWWASFLNKNKNIIAPKNFYPGSNININDYYINNWNLI